MNYYVCDEFGTESQILLQRPERLLKQQSWHIGLDKA
jgi:hypothetical protein